VKFQELAIMSVIPVGRTEEMKKGLPELGGFYRYARKLSNLQLYWNSTIWLFASLLEIAA
jgi:hypothetical protein